MHSTICTVNCYSWMSLRVSDEHIKTYGDTSEKICIIFLGDDPEKEERILSESLSGAFIIGIRVDDWNSDLSPWNAPPVFGNEAFGEGAGKLLASIEETVIPFINESYGRKVFLIAGYSLAGLFALYSVYQSGSFAGAVAVSPSVWFPGWNEFVTDKKPNAAFIYLSLGNKEEKTKNKAMSAVGDNIRFMHEHLLEQGITACLEWNEGGHFRDIPDRIGKGLEKGLKMYNGS